MRSPLVVALLVVTPGRYGALWATRLLFASTVASVVGVPLVPTMAALAAAYCSVTLPAVPPFETVPWRIARRGVVVPGTTAAAPKVIEVPDAVTTVGVGGGR